MGRVRYSLVTSVTRDSAAPSPKLAAGPGRNAMPWCGANVKQDHARKSRKQFSSTPANCLVKRVLIHGCLDSD